MKRAPYHQLQDAAHGPSALTGFLIGPLGLTLLTLLDRRLTYPSGYLAMVDVLVHGAIESIFAAALGFGVWGCFTALLWIAKGPLRKVNERLLVAAFGLTLAFGVYRFVVYPSILRSMLPMPAWLFVLGGVLILLLLTLRWLLTRPVPARAAVWALVIATGASALHLVALHLFSRFYGNLHLLASVCAALAASFAANLALLAFEGTHRVARLVALSLLAVSLLALPHHLNDVQRRAILQRGAFATRSIEVLWRALDSDADGAPESLWGTDPDDSDPRISPLSRQRSVPKTPLRPLGKVKAEGSSLLWVIVDTTRRDSLERCFANDGRLASLYARFRFYKGYSSCSARTFQVLHRFFGLRKCDGPFTAELGDGNLLDWMSAHGRSLERIRVIDDFDNTPFGADLTLKSDKEALSRARTLLADPRAEQRFFVLHLRGGHAPYEGPGNTPRQRYDSQVCGSFRDIAKLFEMPELDGWTIAIAGDHGEEFREHGSLYHGAALYEELLSAPLLMRSSRLAAGVDQTPLGCADVPGLISFATGITEAAPAPTNLQFASIDILRGTWGFLRDAGLRSLRRDGWKVIWDPYLDVWELYDLQHDPHERNDLSGREGARLQPLKAELLEAARRCDATTPNLQDRRFDPLK